VLIVATAALAAAAVYLRLRRTPEATPPVATMSDAGVADASVTAPLTPDALVIAPVDAGVPVGVVDASVPVDAGAPSDAAPTRPGPSPEEEKSAQAKSLLDRATEAISEGAFDRALRSADQSLALRKTWRAYLTRAKALQRLERVDEALAAIDAAEKLAPRNANVFELRGRILWAVRRKDEARRQFERFLQLEPTGGRAQQIQKLLAEP
jgi:tetratricopeptide (TPR) repeat protein